MPFKNVEYVDDLFTWVEAGGLGEDDDPAGEDNEDAEETLR